MTSHRAMKDLAENPVSIRALAASLLSLAGRKPPMEWTDWEVDFLQSMAGRDTSDPLSMRQREVLVELRDAANRHDTVDGLSVPRLIEACASDCVELSSEDDQQFVSSLKRAGLASLSRRQLGRLLRVARELGVIENHQGFMS